MSFNIPESETPKLFSLKSNRSTPSLILLTTIWVLFSEAITERNDE